MNTVVRAFVWVLVVAWVGGVMFFPVVAAVSFGALPDTHMAGAVARLCLIALHREGLIAGAGIVILLAVTGAMRAGPRARWRPELGPMATTFVMLALTGLSQYSIIPRMEKLRLSVGGDTNAAARTDPARLEFDRLHRASVIVEEGVLGAGLILIVLLARMSREL